MSQTPSQARLRTVQLDDTSTMHLSLTVSDPEVTAALREKAEGRERERYALTALRIGVAAMRQASGMIDADAIRREGGNLVKELQSSVELHRAELEKNVAKVLEGFLDPENGQLSQRIKRLVNREDGELTKLIEDQLTGDNSLLARQLTSQLGQDSPLLKKLDPDNKQGVLALMEGQIKTLLDEQRAAVLGEFSTDNEESALSRLIKKVTDLQQATTNQLSLDSDDSALSRLKKEFDQAQEKIRKQLSLDVEGSSMATIQNSINQRLEKLLKDQGEFQTEVAKTIAEMATRKTQRAASTLHGGDFEDELQVALNDLKGSDILMRCGDTTGLIPNSKVGDFVIEMSDESRFVGQKIAIEAKQAQNYKDISKALSETEIAIKNRGAKVGIFVLSARTIREHDEGGKSHDWDRSLQRHGNKILVIWDPEAPELNPILGAAVTLAKAMLSEANAGAAEAESLEIDFELLDKSINDIEKQVERFDKMNTWADNITRDAGKVKDELAKIAKSLSRDAERIREEVDTLR